MSDRGNRKYQVHLSPEQRDHLLGLTRTGSAPARTLLHARILLLADEDHADGQRPDDYIAAALGTCRRTVNRTRRRFVEQGEAPALDRKPRATPPAPPKIDGRVEAHLVALCCSPAPAGHARWTLRLLARELGRLEVVTGVSHEAVRRVLKKTGSGRGGPSGSASRSGTGPGSSPRWSRCSTRTRPGPTRAPR